MQQSQAERLVGECGALLTDIVRFHSSMDSRVYVPTEAAFHDTISDFEVTFRGFADA